MLKINKMAFTLSEVLITIVIIGIISAITVPVMLNNFKWKQYRASYLKAISVLDGAIQKYRIEYGEVPECGYWITNPYDGLGAHCSQYNESGNCTGYAFADGSPLPSDYNGNFADCEKLYKFFLKNLNISKICENNAYSNGCIPKYDGNDTVYKRNNTGVSDYDATKAIAGCANFSQSVILTKPAFVTSDGMIFFPYTINFAHVLAVDVNGFKGPNKWGHDLRVVMAKSSNKNSEPKYFTGTCEALDKGGVKSKDLLYDKKYM
jgi:prepilin-type N-terminal cleavage/methylation domain-containing protein